MKFIIAGKELTESQINMYRKVMELHHYTCGCNDMLKMVVRELGEINTLSCELRKFINNKRSLLNAEIEIYRANGGDYTYLLFDEINPETKNEER